MMGRQRNAGAGQQMNGDWLRNIAGQLAARRDGAGGGIPGAQGGGGFAGGQGGGLWDGGAPGVVPQGNPALGQGALAQGRLQAMQPAGPGPARPAGGPVPLGGVVPQLQRNDVPPTPGSAPGPQGMAQFAPGWTQKFAGAFTPQGASQDARVAAAQSAQGPAGGPRPTVMPVTQQGPVLRTAPPPAAAPNPQQQAANAAAQSQAYAQSQASRAAALAQANGLRRPEDEV